MEKRTGCVLLPVLVVVVVVEEEAAAAGGEVRRGYAMLCDALRGRH